MSIYLVHSGVFYQNQFRVLFDWFDFIHRCSFHSRWSCQNHAVIAALDPHTSFHSTQLHSMIIAYSMLTFSLSVCLFVPNLLPPFPGHWFRIQSSIDSFPSFHHNPDWLILHVPILCMIDVKNENKEFMRNRRSKLTKSSLIQCSK